MASWTYTTRQGDTWDRIALDAYGTEMLAGYLQQANIGYTNLVYFPAGIVLTIPSTPAEATAGLAPPWKRAVESAEYPEPVGRLMLDYSRFVRVAGLAATPSAGPVSTADVVHGDSKQPLGELLDKLIAYIATGGPFYRRDPDTGDVYIRDTPAEF